MPGCSRGDTRRPRGRLAWNKCGGQKSLYCYNVNLIVIYLIRIVVATSCEGKVSQPRGGNQVIEGKKIAVTPGAQLRPFYFIDLVRNAFTVTSAFANVAPSPFNRPQHAPYYETFVPTTPHWH